MKKTSTKPLYIFSAHRSTQTPPPPPKRTPGHSSVTDNLVLTVWQMPISAELLASCSCSTQTQGKYLLGRARGGPTPYEAPASMGLANSRTAAGTSCNPGQGRKATFARTAHQSICARPHRAGWARRAHPWSPRQRCARGGDRGSAWASSRHPSDGRATRTSAARWRQRPPVLPAGRYPRTCARGWVMMDGGRARARQPSVLYVSDDRLRPRQ